jgi:hypothetical protein
MIYGDEINQIKFNYLYMTSFRFVTTEAMFPFFFFFFFLNWVETYCESNCYCGPYWPIVPAPGDCEDGEFGGMNGRGNRSTRENLPRRHFVHHKSHLTRPGCFPCFHAWDDTDKMFIRMCCRGSDRTG